MAYVGDFTLSKDEAFGDYHVDTSHNSTRHIRATVKNYEEIRRLHFCRIIQKENKRRVHLRAQKNQLHAGRVWKVTCYGKIIFTTLRCQEGCQKVIRNSFRRRGRQSGFW